MQKNVGKLKFNIDIRQTVMFVYLYTYKYEGMHAIRNEWIN